MVSQNFAMVKMETINIPWRSSNTHINWTRINVDVSDGFFAARKREPFASQNREREVVSCFSCAYVVLYKVKGYMRIALETSLIIYNIILTRKWKHSTKSYEY